MYNYHTELIWAIDIFLLTASVVLSLYIMARCALMEYLWRRRSSSLLGIKKNVYGMVLAGRDIDKKESSKLIAQTTPEQFLDVTTNRNRELIFFNESERKIFKDYYFSPENISNLEKTARKNINKWRRIEAMLSLGYAGTPSAIDMLGKKIYDKDEDVSYFSMVALGQIRQLQSAKALLDFGKRTISSRYKLFSILETFPESITDEIIKLAKDDDRAVRLWAVKLLSRFRPKRHVQTLKDLVRDNDVEVRAAACECLGDSGVKDVEGLLKERLIDEEWRVRASAVKALSNLLGAQAVPAIVGLMSDGSLTVVNNIKNVLTEYVETALPHLEKYLFEDNPIAKNMAIQVLEESGYVEKLLKGLLADDAGKANKAMRILEVMVKYGGRLGVEWVLSNIEQADQEKIMERIAAIDPNFSGQITKKSKGDIIE